MAVWRLGVPLAWYNLTQNGLRLVLSAAGIALAVVLMFVQLGCRNALLDSNVQLIRQLDADLILLSSKQTTLASHEGFSYRRLAQVRALSEVAAVLPLRIEYASSQLRNASPEDDRPISSRAIRVLGIDPRVRMLKLPELDPNDPQAPIHELALPGRALSDRNARKDLRHPDETVFGPLDIGVTTDLNNRKIQIVGTFALGSDFGTDGTLIVSSDTFVNYLRLPFTQGNPFAEVELGLIHLKREYQDSAERTRVQQHIQSMLRDGDVMVLTIEELEDHEKAFWLGNTPIGFVFTLGLVVGVVVGAVICYQILSSDVSDRLGQYATLKALGYTNRYLSGVVLQQAVLLALLGFIPGLAASAVVYRILTGLTDLPMQLTWTRAGQILALTMAMCVGSGLFAVRKAQKADPAEVF